MNTNEINKNIEKEDATTKHNQKDIKSKEEAYNEDNDSEVNEEGYGE